MESESGRRSPSTSFTCGICMDGKPEPELFAATGPDLCANVAGHRPFCRDCMGLHVAATIRDAGGAAVRCPEPRCRAALEPGSCRSLPELPEELVVRWEAAACEALVRAECCTDFEGSCTLALAAGGRGTGSGCARCGRAGCGACRQRAREGRYLDKKLKRLAKSNKWKKCPGCKIYVEKNTGCDHMTCWCEFEFCYKCGKEWRTGHDCISRYLRRQMLRLRALALFKTCTSPNNSYHV